MQSTYKLSSKSKSKLTSIFSASDPALLGILSQMLEFNPCFRPTAEQLISNKYFDDIRVNKNEIKASHKIIVGIDKNKLKYDYENDHMILNDADAIKEFKKKVIQEVNKFYTK